VKFSLEAAKSAQNNATIGMYDASAGMLFLRLIANLKLVINSTYTLLSIANL